MQKYKDTPFYLHPNGEVIACLLGREEITGQWIFVACPGMTTEEADSMTGIKDVIEFINNQTGVKLTNYVDRENNNPWKCYIKSHTSDVVGEIFMGDILEVHNIITELRKTDSSIPELPEYLYS